MGSPVNMAAIALGLDPVLIGLDLLCVYAGHRVDEVQRAVDCTLICHCSQLLHIAIGSPLHKWSQA